jgi:hypothetical protein
MARLQDQFQQWRWLHGDFRDVAYFYNYKLFDDMVGIRSFEPMKQVWCSIMVFMIWAIRCLAWPTADFFFAGSG